LFFRNVTYFYIGAFFELVHYFRDLHSHYKIFTITPLKIGTGQDLGKWKERKKSYRESRSNFGFLRFEAERALLILACKLSKVNHCLGY
jgi:hypothetical protein